MQLGRGASLVLRSLLASMLSGPRLLQLLLELLHQLQGPAQQGWRAPPWLGKPQGSHQLEHGGQNQALSSEKEREHEV